MTTTTEKKETVGKTAIQSFADWLAIIKGTDELFEVKSTKTAFVIRRVKKK